MLLRKRFELWVIAVRGLLRRWSRCDVPRRSKDSLTSEHRAGVRADSATHTHPHTHSPPPPTHSPPHPHRHRRRHAHRVKIRWHASQLADNSMFSNNRHLSASTVNSHCGYRATDCSTITPRYRVMHLPRIVCTYHEPHAHTHARAHTRAHVRFFYPLFVSCDG